jgi:S-adenosylmethionine synthetase
MPTPIMFAHRLGRELTAIRKSARWPGSGPMQNRRFRSAIVDGKPVEVVNVVISTQHTDDVDHARSSPILIRNVIKKVIPAKLLNEEHRVSHQPHWPVCDGWPAGRLRSHRPQDHRRYLRWLGASRRRRLLRQGSVEGRPLGRLHGALGCQERSWPRARDDCRASVAYAIGHPKPVSVFVDTFGTGTASLDEVIAQAVQDVSVSSRPTSSNSSICCARFIGRPPTTATSAKKGLPWEVTEQGRRAQSAR